jgi:putative nucleotidyltransferase with HDIG domain
MTAGLQAAREALAGRRAWLVGGDVRDRLLGARPRFDVDVVIDGDPQGGARAIARAAGGAACFELSREFGAWRVMARDGGWQVDVEPMRGGSIEADLALRDFTVNAIAEPLEGGPPIDPHDGLGDLERRRLRMVAPAAFEADPLRVLRLARLAVELDLEPDPDTVAQAQRDAPGLRSVSGERVFAELRRIVASKQARRGIELSEELGAADAVLPELELTRGVEQNRFHHLDVHGHTLEVLERTIELGELARAHTPSDLGGTSAPGPAGGGAGVRDQLASSELVASLAGQVDRVARLLNEPLADELTRGEALRWGALLHDAAKPLTRATAGPGGRVTFMGHDVRGAELSRAVLGRLRASERLRSHVAGLVRHHLRLGFLVHQPQPLAPRRTYAYLQECGPVAADVTLLSLADRFATRGEGAPEAIAAHVRLAQQMLEAALEWQERGPAPALIRGDDLARELAIPTGPRLGELLAELGAAQYAGEISTREQAIAHARAYAQNA